MSHNDDVIPVRLIKFDIWRLYLLNEFVYFCLVAFIRLTGSPNNRKWGGYFRSMIWFTSGLTIFLKKKPESKWNFFLESRFFHFIHFNHLTSSLVLNQRLWRHTNDVINESHWCVIVMSHTCSFCRSFKSFSRVNRNSCSSRFWTLCNWELFSWN